MNLDYYRNFLTIVECGSIRAAARSIRIAQPALSKQLQVLEGAFGARLLERGARSVTLTEAGEILYRKARHICSIDDDARQEIRDRARGIGGTLTIAIPPTGSRAFLHRIFAPFVANNPAVRLDIQEADSHRIAANLLEGLAELGFINAPIANAELFDLYPVQQGRVVVALPPGHPLYAKQTISLQDLAGYPLAISKSLLSLIRAAGGIGEQLQVLVTATSRHSVECLAQMRGCAAIYTDYGEPKEDGDNAELRPLCEPTFHTRRAFLVPKNRELGPAARAFLAEQGIAR